MAKSRTSVPERITIAAATGAITRQQYDSETLILEGNDTLTQDFSLALASSLAPFEDDHRVEVFYFANIDVDAFDLTIFGKKLTKAQAAEGLLRIVAVFNKISGTHDVFIDDQLNGMRQGDSSLDLDSDQTISPLENNDHLIVLDPTNVSANRVFDIVTDPTSNNHWRFLFLGGEVDAGFTWELKNSGFTHFTLNPGLIQPQIVDLIWTDAGYHISQLPIAMNSAIDPKVDLRFGDSVSFTYDYAVHGGAQGTIEFDVPLPNGAILLLDKAFFDVEDPLSSAGLADVEWGIGSGADTDILQSVLDFDNAKYASANGVSYGDGTINKRVSSGEKPSLTITTADLDGGKVHVRIPYYVNEY